jgi:hypothetical protein
MSLRHIAFAKAYKINPEVVNSSYSHTELKQLSYCWLYEYFRSKLFGSTLGMELVGFIEYSITSIFNQSNFQN